MYILHTDAGHGWLEVEKEELEMSGAAPHITGFSYRDGNTFYLEEDYDLCFFMFGMMSQGIRIEFQERYDGDYSFIRNLPRVDSKSESNNQDEAFAEYKRLKKLATEKFPEILGIK
jgi:hypothetical protein